MDENEIKEKYIADCDMEIFSSSKSLGFNIQDNLIAEIDGMIEDGKTEDEIIEFVDDFIYEFSRFCNSVSVNEILEFRKNKK